MARYTKNTFLYSNQKSLHAQAQKEKMGYCQKAFQLTSSKVPCLSETLWIFGIKLYLAAPCSEKGELMWVATHANPKKAIAIYLRRWEIECFFQRLKDRGFRFEETHITSLERIEKLMVLRAIGFYWLINSVNGAPL